MLGLARGLSLKTHEQNQQTGMGHCKIEDNFNLDPLYVFAESQWKQGRH